MYVFNFCEKQTITYFKEMLMSVQSIKTDRTSELEHEYELAIIGAGPAGLTAAIYAARTRINHVILEKNTIPGGQIVHTEIVENYPGFEEPVGGFDLMAKFHKQAGNFNANIVITNVSNLSMEKRKFKITTDSGETYARAVIIASGAQPRLSGAKNETKFIGKGISFCATCDGAFFRGKDIAVIGGGDAGIEEGIFLTRFANKVTVIEMMDSPGAAEILQERARENPKMEIMTAHVPVEIIGDNVVQQLIVKGRNNDSKQAIDVSGIFVYVGIKPNTDFIAIEDLTEDKDRFIVTDAEMRTNIPGLFVAGDARAKTFRQVSTAVGDGATAEHSAEKYLESIV